MNVFDWFPEVLNLAIELLEAVLDNKIKYMGWKLDVKVFQGCRAAGSLRLIIDESLQLGHSNKDGQLL